MASTQEHLERLIFEVYGADEAKSKIEKLREAEEKHAKSLRGLKKEAKQAAREQAKAAEEMARAQQKATEETVATLKQGGVALAALAALAVKASNDLDTATGKYERSARAAGMGASEMAKALAISDERSRQLGRGLIAGREQLSALLDVTKDYRLALEDQARIQDIVATGDANAEQALELLTKARKGEIAELIKLDGFNRDNIEALNKIEDRATRTALAMEIVTERYKGAAVELRDNNTAMDNLKEASTDLLAAIGGTGTGLVNAFAEFIGVVEPGEDVMDRFATGMRNFARDAKEASSYLDVWVQWQKQGAIWGDKSFAEVMSERDSARAKSGTGKPAAAPKPDREIDPRLFGFIGPTAPEAETKKKAGKSADPTLDGFIGDFGGDQQSLEEVAGQEQQALQEAEDRRRTYLNNIAMAEREHAEEVKRIYEDQAEFKRKLDENTFLREKKAREQAQQAAWAGAEAAAGLATSFIKDEGGKAIIQGGMETARAIAAGASGNIPGAIGHGAAAAQFFAVAAQAGMGGAKSKKGASGGGAPSSLSSDRERVQLQNEQSRSRESRAPQTHVVNVYSTFGPSPQQSRELVDAVEREMRNRTTSRM